MRANGVCRLVLVASLILTGSTSYLHSQHAVLSSGKNARTHRREGREKLKFVVMLSRHGVRSSTWTQERLDAYSAQPWPQWKAQPGYLTERGFELVKQFGSYDRISLARAGLLAPQGCADAAATYIWADTDQRTMESGRALAEGLFPGCAPAVHGVAAGTYDRLFHPGKGEVSAGAADAAFTELSARVKAEADPERSELIAEMQNVLLGCAPKAACSAAQKPAKMLAAGGVAATRGGGDHFVELRGPLAEASSFAEDFLLEYGDGMAANKVGWGKVDEPQLRRFLALHTEYFDLIHRTPTLARIEAGNLLQHMVGTLEQHVKGGPAANAVGPVQSKVVVLVGHDTNLAGVSALLGLHWKLDGRRDDTPPGTELAFELWQSPRGEWSVRVRASMQTLGQMRSLRELTQTAPPASQLVQVDGCGTAAEGCSWSEFQRIALAGTGNGAASRTTSEGGSGN